MPIHGEGLSSDSLSLAQDQSANEQYNFDMEPIFVPELNNTPASSRGVKRKRTLISYNNACDKTKFNRNKGLLEGMETEQLLDILKSRFDDFSSKRLIDLLKQPENDRYKMYQKLNSPDPIYIKSEEALALMSELDMTHANYIRLRYFFNEKGYDIFPTIINVMEEKNKCYPLNVDNSETHFEVPLQDMQNHTIQRLSKTIDIEQSVGNKLKLKAKWGIDAQGGKNPYNVKTLTETNSDYSSILHTAIVAINLTDEKKSNYMAKPSYFICSLL